MAHDSGKQQEGRIRSFTDLRVWKEGRKLVQMIYDITRHFPPEEKFGLASQLQRAVVSVTSNIAEGFAKRTMREKRQFFNTSLSSLMETQNQLVISHDIGYVSSEKFTTAAAQTVVVSKMLNGLWRTAKDKAQ